MNESLLGDVTIHPHKGTGATVAYGDLKYGDVYLDFSVLQGKNGLFVNLPRRKKDDGTWVDMVRPSSKEVREGIQEYILKAYRKMNEHASQSQLDNSDVDQTRRPY
jgi:DNA-binding cell septation regulator SpoVG